jgi:uncharacterized membrane protein
MGLALFLHVSGVVLFLGNIVTAAFWKIHTERTGDLMGIQRVVKGVMVADYVFTLPGIVLILATGHWMAHQSGFPLFGLSWLGISYMLFILAGLVWGVILLPAQLKMIRESALSVAEGKLTKGYRKWSSIWNGFGTLATLIPITIMLLMVLKP